MCLMTTENKSGEFIPKQRGRPHTYSPDMCEKIIKIGEEGGHVAEMCKAIGIRSRDTFYRWVREIDEFKEAYDTATLYSQAWYEKVMRAGALGQIKGFNFNAMAMTMNNKFRDDYKIGSHGASTNIEIGSINTAELNLDELLQKAKQLTQDIEALPNYDEE